MRKRPTQDDLLAFIESVAHAYRRKLGTDANERDRLIYGPKRFSNGNN